MLENNLTNRYPSFAGTFGLGSAKQVQAAAWFSRAAKQGLPEAEKRFNAVQTALSAHKHEVLKKQVLSFLLITNMAIYLWCLRCKLNLHHNLYLQEV